MAQDFDDRMRRCIAQSIFWLRNLLFDHDDVNAT
jgi:hypothetical protein